MLEQAAAMNERSSYKTPAYEGKNIFERVQLFLFRLYIKICLNSNLKIKYCVWKAVVEKTKTLSEGMNVIKEEFYQC